MNLRPLSKTTISFIIAIVYVTTFCPSGLSKESSLVVPVKLERKRVIIPTSVQGSRPLNLILDTGMPFDGVYLFHKEFAGLLDTTGAIEVRVPGAGSGEASTALMIENASLVFGDVKVDSQQVIIAQSYHTQSFPTDGVIGWNLFGHYAVEIDYDAEQITLHDTTVFKPDSTWLSVPVAMKGGLPFFEIRVEVVKDEIVPIVVYIDLASDEALELLTKPDQKYTLPDVLYPSYLGTGLSGDIYGSRGRSLNLWLGEYRLSDVATSFAPAAVRSKREGGDGVLGNDCIRRFNVIFDYTHQLIFLRPNSYFEIPFD